MLNRRLIGVAAGMLTTIGAAAWFTGCSATIGGGGGGGDAGLRLSSNKLNPGQFVELFSSKIQFGTTLKVRFQGPGGFDVEAETILTDNGSARVAVPPLIDMQTGEFLEGEVQVSLPELSGGSVDLTVQALPQINSPSPGALLREVLLMSLEVADAAEAKAAAIAADLPDAVESPSDLEFFTQQRAAIAGILEELDATGQLTVEAANGTIVTLTAQDLALGDRLLASYLVGIIDETGGDSSVALKTATRLLGQGESILDFEALKEEFRRVSNNIVNGGGAFLGSMTLLVAGGGLLLAGTGPVAVVGGLVLTVGGAVWAIGSSGILNGIGSYFDQKLGELFNLGETTFDQAISVGTEALGTLKGKLGQLFSGVSTLLTAQGTYENFTRLECQTNPAPEQKRGSDNSQHKSRQPLFANGGFCAIVRPPGCDNSCTLAFDGLCDDGGPDSFSDICALGTDCVDCGPRGGGDVPAGGALCSNTCTYALDGECDDGASGSFTSLCDLGTDCGDCGTRNGDGATVPGPDSLGTCCEANGLCQLVTQATCTTTFGGTYNSGSATCSPNPCPQPPEPTGACCVSGVCSELTVSGCAALQGGVYSGDGMTCATVECAPPVEYLVWYTGNVCCWGAPLIYIDTRDSFNTPESAASYPGGGIDYSVPLVKTELQGGFASADEARAWICPQFTSRSFHYWCTQHYQMGGKNWQNGLGCDLNGLPETSTPPDVNGCQ